MSLAHLRTRRRLALLASDVLEGSQRQRVLAHVAECHRCDAELQGLRAALAEVARDPAHDAEPALDHDTLVRLTQLRIDRLAASQEPIRRRPWLVWAPLAAVAAAAAIALLVRLPAGAPAQPVASVAAAQPQDVSWPDESLRRLERTVEREQAARYLSEAEAVFVNVAATPQRCDLYHATVDMAQERRRSRELLARGALLVDFDSEEIRSVRPVLEDVERVLRQVATLDPCARPEELSAIHEELRERRLLMKIDLMTRELLG